MLVLIHYHNHKSNLNFWTLVTAPDNLYTPSVMHFSSMNLMQLVNITGTVQVTNYSMFHESCHEMQKVEQRLIIINNINSYINNIIVKNNNN